MKSIVEWDIHLFVYLNNLGNKLFDPLWLFITNEYNWIPVYFLLFIIVIDKYGWKKTLLIGVCIGLMIAVTDNIASLFKYWVKRPRPCKTPELDDMFRLVIDKCRGTYCFFSAHAASSFALAYYFSALLYKKHKYVPYLFFIWASLVAYSRIYVGVHFPLDIITGTFIGILIGYLFSKTQKLILKNKEK